MKLLRTFGTTFLALLVVVASSNFFVSLHVCGGKVNAIALLAEADGCGHGQLPPCHRSMMKGCCSDQQIEHPAQDLKKDVTTIPVLVPSATDMLHTSVVLAELVPSLETTFLGNSAYSPPFRAVDFTVLHEVFLI